jgi:hypothetical protein
VEGRTQSQTQGSAVRSSQPGPRPGPSRRSPEPSTSSYSRSLSRDQQRAQPLANARAARNEFVTASSAQAQEVDYRSVSLSTPSASRPTAPQYISQQEALRQAWAQPQPTRRTADPFSRAGIALAAFMSYSREDSTIQSSSPAGGVVLSGGAVVTSSSPSQGYADTPAGQELRRQRERSPSPSEDQYRIGMRR